MSAKSLITQLWVPLAGSAMSTAAVGFAINYLTADGRAHWWWWVVLACGTVGIVVCGAWTYRLQSNSDRQPTHTGPDVVPQDAGGAPQPASVPGPDITITARDNSVAAWQVGTVNMGGEDRKPDRS